MSIDVAIRHRTRYRYDRRIALSPHVVRLRPAPHCRTRILSYSQTVSPAQHFLNWQQDPFGNWMARLVFPEKTDHLFVEIDLIARLEAINPFDFFLDDDAQEAGFAYAPDLLSDLAPYMKADPVETRLRDFLRDAPANTGRTIDFMVAINQYVQSKVGYIVRMEPGVQTPETTLERCEGSCRDSAWLLVQALRTLGYAARFVSGYLVQLKADEAPVSGPAGPAEDFTDLHAWAEVYLPGAGWVGLDATSGLFAGEGHIPLAATPAPSSAAPIDGLLEKCEVTFDFDMSVTRVSEPPRVTKPVTDGQWAAIKGAGAAIDARLKARDVRLTVGGEPTFVSATDRDADEWTIAAVGPTKRDHADRFIRRLRDRFAPGGALQYGQGKWYPGETLPRWAFELHWRGDGAPLWRDPDLIARETETGADIAGAEKFMRALCVKLGVPPAHAYPTYEDPGQFLLKEHGLPINREPGNNELSDPEARRRLARVFDRGIDKPVAYALPIQSAQAPHNDPRRRWLTEMWVTRREEIFLAPGDSPAGLRLPLEALPWLPADERPVVYERDPFAPRFDLPAPSVIAMQTAGGREGAAAPSGVGPVRTALAVEPRGGKLCVFLPPLQMLEDYVALISAVEDVASEQSQRVHVEGYSPPRDSRLNVIRVTPDPGVIEINIHPSTSWEEQAAIFEALYEEARACGLDASTFLLDGRPTGSGGGNHIVMGGPTVADSPFLRRPDLLASIIRYWQTHPSLSYLFSGLFIGPTSQAPRFDEARNDNLYEMEIALEQLPATGDTPPWLVDRLFRNLLIDVTGNTHRAEICIDKMYSPDGPTGRLGLVEFRAFEMPPHPRMASAQALLMRALIALFWDKPCTAPLVRWGTALHDRFMLPAFVEADFHAVLADLSAGLGVDFDPAWFAAQVDFRFPVAGSVSVAGAEIELRHALEPWPVMGETGAIGGTTRFVDSSMERMQIRVRDLPEGAALAVNGIAAPLTALEDGSQVAGVRFRAWRPAQ